MINTKDNIENKGFCIISNFSTLKNNDIIDIMDKEGYKYRKKVNYIINGKRFDIVNKNNPFSIDNIKLFIKLNNLKCELLSKEFINNTSLLEFKCSCGNIFSISWSELLRRKNKNNKGECNICTGGINRKKSTKEDLIQRLKILGYELCDKNFIYKKSKQIFDIKDFLGYKYITSYSECLSLINTNCKKDRFSIYNPYTLDNIKLWLKLNNIGCKLLSDEIKLTDEKLLFTCEECGEPFYCTFKHLRNSGQTRCKKCTKSTSKYEYIIQEYLKDKNIKFSQQKKFENCKDIRELPFDFCIYNKDDILCLIEIDGQQHYREVEFHGSINNDSKERFEITKKHDKIKDEFCKENNIKLIRIPYFKFKNKEYENIIEKIIKQV